MSTAMQHMQTMKRRAAAPYLEVAKRLAEHLNYEPWVPLRAAKCIYVVPLRVLTQESVELVWIEVTTPHDFIERAHRRAAARAPAFNTRDSFSVAKFRRPGLFGQSRRK